MKKFDVTLRSYGYVNEALSNCFHLYCKDGKHLTNLVYSIRGIVMCAELGEVDYLIEQTLNEFCGRPTWQLREDLSNPIRGVLVYQNERDRYYLSIEWDF